MGSEIEAKLELSSHAYLSLLSLGVKHKAAEQLNIYYDSSWMLAGTGATFRIRYTRKDGPVCTLKIPRTVELSGLRIATEIEAPVNCVLSMPCTLSPPREIIPRRQLSQEFREALAPLHVERLSRVGWVRNKRTVVNVSGLGQIELDELRLPNGTTYFEVEIEHADREVIAKLATAVLSRCPSARPSLISKFERFRRAALEVTSRRRLAPGSQRL